MNRKRAFALALGSFLHVHGNAQTTSPVQPSAQSECDPGSLTAAAPSDGYGFHPLGRYCEGLVVEQHSAPTLQVVSFSMATEALAAAETLVLRTPLVAGQSTQLLRGRNISGAAAYRFDARVRDLRPFELNLNRVAAKHKIDAMAMAFVGEALIDGAAYLIPVAIGKTSGRTDWPSKYLLSVRLSSAAASISYALLPISGGPAIAKGLVEGPLAADELVSFPIDASRPGIYRLNLEVLSIAGSGSARITAFTRRIYTGNVR